MNNLNYMKKAKTTKIRKLKITEGKKVKVNKQLTLPLKYGRNRKSSGIR